MRIAWAFLVLRKMTMVGDAISHAVLPGIAIAYWLSQSRASLGMFLGGNSGCWRYNNYRVNEKKASRTE